MPDELVVAEPPFEHPDAVAAQAADHRPAGGWPEVGAGHTELIRDGFADARSNLTPQLIAAHDGRGLGDIECLLAQSCGGDDDFLRRSFAGCRLRCLRDGKACST